MIFPCDCERVYNREHHVLLSSVIFSVTATKNMKEEKNHMMDRVSFSLAKNGNKALTRGIGNTFGCYSVNNSWLGALTKLVVSSVTYLFGCFSCRYVNVDSNNTSGSSNHRLTTTTTTSFPFDFSCYWLVRGVFHRFPFSPHTNSIIILSDLVVS